jgi:hypothetical protein
MTGVELLHLNADPSIQSHTRPNVHAAMILNHFRTQGQTLYLIQQSSLEHHFFDEDSGVKSRAAFLAPRNK